MRVLVVDIGGSFIKYAVMDETARMYEKGKVKTPESGREELVGTIGGLFDFLALSFPLEGIAMSVPGIIDPGRGYIIASGAIKYNEDFYLREALLKRCPGIKITMYNDAKCAAQAEGSVGALSDVSDGAVILFGTMIGGGIILNHKVRQGVHFSAGEVSYILSDRAADPSEETVWGNRCGTPRLCKLYADAKGMEPVSVNGEMFFSAVESKDPLAVEVLHRFAKEIAVQIFNMQNLLDLERFAIGGGISEQPAFILAIRDELKRLYDISPYAVSKVDVVACHFHNDANLIGALMCYQLEK